MPIPTCAQCVRLSGLYFKLVKEHSRLMERQRLMSEEERADVEPLVLRAHKRVEMARAEFIEHRQTHAEPETETRG